MLKECLIQHQVVHQREHQKDNDDLSRSAIRQLDSQEQKGGELVKEDEKQRVSKQKRSLSYDQKEKNDLSEDRRASLFLALPNMDGVLDNVFLINELVYDLQQEQIQLVMPRSLMERVAKQVTLVCLKWLL